jgi:uncharacterized membrane protein
MNAIRVFKYFCITVAIAAVLEVIILLLGYWLKVRIPIGVTLGLLAGVVAWFASKLHSSNKQ